MHTHRPRRWISGLRRLCPLALGLLALLLGPSAARAEEPAARRGEAVALLQLGVQGMTREVEQNLRAALRDALQQCGFDLMAEAEVEGKLQRDPQIQSCTSRSCFTRLSLTLGVRRVVEGEVQRQQRSTHRARLWLRDLRSGQVVAGPEEERCDICGTEEARQMLVRVAQRLCRAAPPLPPDKGQADTGTLQVDSQPLGAEVLIDGERQEDRTPAMFLLPVGVHSLEVRAPGYRPVRRPVEIEPGRHVALNLELTAVPPRRPWLTALSAALVTGAVGLGVTSGVLWHFHNKPVYGYPAEEPCAQGQPRCPYKYDNRLGGGLTAALAAALAIGGGVAIYYDYAPPKRKLVVTPTLPGQTPEQAPKAP